MKRRVLSLSAPVLALASALLAAAATVPEQPPVPRKAPEYEINMPAGKSILLSSFKGKVVLLEFLNTGCQHCQHAATLYSKIQKDFGPRGFQPLGAAINDKAETLIPPFVRENKVTYPVGFTTMEATVHFLQIDPAKRWGVPQVVIIDRKGTIRYQTAWTGEDKAQDEAFVRNLIDGLLKEPAGALAAKKATAK
jgi:peroxiredoxin